MTGDTRAVVPVVSVILVTAVVVILASTVSIFVLQLGEDVSDSGPNVVFEIEYDYFDDGVPKNDSVRITHTGGDVLDRERLEVVIGNDVVYNETADSETTNPNFAVPGLIVEVDDGNEFNDLNKPCRVDGQRVSPVGTCGGPPGDGDGSDSGVVLQWAENVSAGETIVIQERNHTNSYDVIEPGDSIKIIYRGDGFTALIAEETVAAEVADE
jgi:FlaG/FlaF family flagellin (archaellin)